MCNSTLVFSLFLDRGHTPRLCLGGSAHDGSRRMQPDPQRGGEQPLHQGRSVCFNHVVGTNIHTDTDLVRTT